mgnify:CR=1 FL=1
MLDRARSSGSDFCRRIRVCRRTFDARAARAIRFARRLAGIRRQLGLARDRYLAWPTAAGIAAAATAHGAASPDGAVSRKPHQPHFQAIDYNPLNGGVARWFEPIAEPRRRRPEHDGDPRVLPDAFQPPRAGDTVSGRSRFISSGSKRGRVRPAGRHPEGLHRDGVDYVLVLLVNRRNIASGMTSIHALDGRPLGHFTLTDPLDAALVDDTKVAHGVTAVAPIDPGKPAYRDVLVATFRKS